MNNTEPRIRSAVYVTITKKGTAQYRHFWRGRLWAMDRASAEASFAAGATIYRKQAGVSIWVEDPEVVIGAA